MVCGERGGNESMRVESIEKECESKREKREGKKKKGNERE